MLTRPAERPGGADLRSRLFYIALALAFTAVSAGIAAVAPVLVYDCERSTSGMVDCTVRARLYGLVPLPGRRLSGIVSADVESTTSRQGSLGEDIYRQMLQTYHELVLVCADGTQWRSFRSTEPLGQSNPELASGIKSLLLAESPTTFHAWTAEKVPLLVSIVFLAPVMIVLLALLARVLLSRGLEAEELDTSLQAVLDERLEAKQGSAPKGSRPRRR